MGKASEYKKGENIKLYEQVNIELSNVLTPTIHEGGDAYYPISYLGDKILFKDLSPSQLKQNGYSEYIKSYKIKYDEKNIQDTYCISEYGLKKILKNSKINRLNLKQKIAMKNLCKYLELDIYIDLKENFLDKFDNWHTYDFWSKECIEEYLKYNPNTKWQKCNKCERYYPYSKEFFEKEGNPNNKSELRTVCKNCKSWSKNRTRINVQHLNSYLHNVYKKYGKEIYLIIKNKEMLKI